MKPPSVPRECRRCGSEFFTRAHALKIGKGLYCSLHCASLRPRPAPIISEDGLTARIPLYARDGAVSAYATVDIADIDTVSKWRWHLTGDGYAARPPGAIRMHREILGLIRKDGRLIDHRNRNRLDNRRSNLRVTTHAGNAQNVTPQVGTSSQFRGVYWKKEVGQWFVQVKTQGQFYWRGYFSDETEAGKVAKEIRLRIMPYAVD